MKRTKIICTMGPNTNDREVLKQLALNGMDIARFNFSHGDHEEQKGRVDLVKSVREELGLPIAMLLDTKGPEIRTGVLEGDKKVTLVEGNTYTLTTKDVVGNDKIGHITYEGLPADVHVGGKILIDDGLIELCVESTNETDIVCRIVNGGELGAKKGVNVPNVSINLPGITAKDRADIIFGIEQGFDFIAASFVRNAVSIHEIRDILREYNADIKIIAKIENAEGIDNIDEIIEAADGIMVARGDMGVEIPAEEVPHVQKMIIRKCNEKFKPVITATQMLDSMMRNPRPTRAEVTDVANAIYDGTDAVMLSGESAAGKYPVEAVKMMAQIAESTEKHMNYEQFLKAGKIHAKQTISGAVSYASVTTAVNLDAKAIIAPTISGFTARVISKYKPEMPVIGMSPNDSVLRQMQIYWGVKPMKSVQETSTDNIMRHAVESIKKAKLVEEGDTVVVTAGIPTTKSKNAQKGISNIMRVVTIE
ncbi:MAG: pyruvate kinase [Lachnospiraceae bacterium]